MCNIDAKTQIGRVILNNDNITDREITVVDPGKKYDRGGQFIDDLQVREPIQFMYRWHNMPSALEIIEGFKEFDKEGSKKKLIKKRDVKIKKLFKNR